MSVSDLLKNKIQSSQSHPEIQVSEIQAVINHFQTLSGNSDVAHFITAILNEDYLKLKILTEKSEINALITFSIEYLLRNSIKKAFFYALKAFKITGFKFVCFIKFLIHLKFSKIK